MKRSVARSPYLWAILAVCAVVTVAWVGRENYQPVITGAEAPDFTYPGLDGAPVSLSDYRGKVVLVNVWATWCPPCIEEMPSMQRLYSEIDSEDFEILAVSVDGRLGEPAPDGRIGGDISAFVDEFGLTFTVLHNPLGDIQRTYQSTGVPESYLIGPDGVIVKKVAGPTQWDADVNKELIGRLLGR